MQIRNKATGELKEIPSQQWRDGRFSPNIWEPSQPEMLVTVFEYYQGVHRRVIGIYEKSELAALSEIHPTYFFEELAAGDAGLASERFAPHMPNAVNNPQDNTYNQPGTLGVWKKSYTKLIVVLNYDYVKLIITAVIAGLILWWLTAHRTESTIVKPHPGPTKKAMSAKPNKS